MYAGKTEELLYRLRRAQFAKQAVMLFKPAIDNRYHVSDVVSHEGAHFPAMTVESALEVLPQVSPNVQVVGLDEAQFFGEHLVDVCQQLANQGKRVIVAGLDMDWRGKPFGLMPLLLAVSEKVTKKCAVCSVCGKDAGFTYKRTKQGGQVEVGGKDVYEARCRVCFHADL
jgi:thymidine kinase